MFGVGIVSMMNSPSSWTACIFALLANQVAAVKNVVCKGMLDKPWARALGPQNTYAVMIATALFFALPTVLLDLLLGDVSDVYAQVSAHPHGNTTYTTLLRHTSPYLRSASPR